MARARCIAPPAVRLSRLLAVCASACMLQALPLQAQAALSGNEQVELAGKGDFDRLAAALETQSTTQTMKVADWHALCYAYFRLKRYDKILPCLDTLESALQTRNKRTRLFGLDDATPTVYLMRAETAIEIGQFSLALEQAQKAHAWFKADGETEKDVLIQALAAQVLAYKNAGQRDRAEQAAGQLQAVQVSAFGDDAIGVKSLAMARAHMALEQWDAALHALALDKTLGLRAFMDNLLSGAFLRGENNWVWLELPRGYMQNKALLELGRTEEARTGFDQMLKVPQIAANGEIYWMTLADRAHIATRDGDLPLAISLYRRALEVIERQRASIHTEANKIGFIGDKQAVYARLVELLFRTGDLPQALEISERAKSRALVDLLASKAHFSAPRQARDARLDIVELINEKTRTDYAALEQSANTVRSQTGGAKPLAAALALPGELQTLVSVNALRVEEIQSLLGEDEAMLSYFSHNNSMVVMLVQKKQVQGALVATDGLESDIRKLRASLPKRLPVDALLRQLYTRLIAPVAAQLPGKRLSIVAHGALHYLPFSSLHDGRGYLAERYTIRMLPSASVLKYIRPPSAQASGKALILGNPDLQDPAMDLPGAQAEAQALGKELASSDVLVRDQATKEAFMQRAPSARFIHLASHGDFDGSNPLSSGLLLAAPAKGQGRLTVSDLYQLSLDAELVTLSACETGLGRIASGDDVVGLTRGFLYAGTSAVLASLWQVDDDSTEFLMLRFYHHLRKNGRGEALRLAQLDTRARFAHPYFWAPFYLTGAY
ncbi:MAG: CHAT domain-containing protein [Burkholderiales bacterium]|nr:CHAT domain-containing protein [Burkholderiales bacterium]